MRKLVTRLLIVGAMLALPGIAYAQDAGVNGTVTDSTGGVLPGVTVTATNDATGNTFVGVTDGRGAFRIPVRVGSYRLTAELAGFATVARPFDALVGQQITVDVQMVTAGVPGTTISRTKHAPSRWGFRTTF